MQQPNSATILQAGPALPQAESMDHIPVLKQMLMKRIAWLVLLSYTILLLKPAVPVFADTLAHTFWEQQHILTVHEENGKFHVHNELVKNTPQSDKDKPASSNSKNQEQECLAACFIPIPHNRPAAILSARAYNRYSCFFPISALTVDDPPPNAFPHLNLTMSHPHC